MAFAPRLPAILRKERRKGKLLGCRLEGWALTQSAEELGGHSVLGCPAPRRGGQVLRPLELELVCAAAQYSVLSTTHASAIIIVSMQSLGLEGPTQTPSLQAPGRGVRSALLPPMPRAACCQWCPNQPTNQPTANRLPGLVAPSLPPSVTPYATCGSLPVCAGKPREKQIRELKLVRRCSKGTAACSCVGVG